MFRETHKINHFNRFGQHISDVQHYESSKSELGIVFIEPGRVKSSKTGTGNQKSGSYLAAQLSTVRRFIYSSH